MKHIEEAELTLFHYGELENRDAITAHLAKCGTCRRELEELQAFLGALDFPVPDPGADYGSQLYARLRFKLKAPHRSRIPWTYLLGPLAAAAVFLASFLLGRLVLDPPMPGQTASIIGERVLRAGVHDHFERLQMFFLDWVNTKDPSQLDMDAQRQWARSLVEDNRLLRQVAYQKGDARVAGFLDDLEMTLLEMSNHRQDDQIAEIEEIRTREDHLEIILKIRDLDKQLTLPGPPRQSSPLTDI